MRRIGIVRGLIYKARWDVEVFFKFVKQLFRVKTFVGTSPNAVRIQACLPNQVDNMVLIDCNTTAQILERDGRIHMEFVKFGYAIKGPPFFED